jgi:hypothetical protein
MTPWLLVAAVVLSTVAADLLQSHGMRRGGRAWHRGHQAEHRGHHAEHRRHQAEHRGHRGQTLSGESTVLPSRGNSRLSLRGQSRVSPPGAATAKEQEPLP